MLRDFFPSESFAFKLCEKKKNLFFFAKTLKLNLFELNDCMVFDWCVVLRLDIM